MDETKIAIMTDSTCDLTNEELKEYNIRMVPMRIVYESREYRDRQEITLRQVLDRMDEEIPHSSLPLPEDVMRCLDELGEEGYTDVLFISVSSALSGTYQMVRLLADQYGGLNIHVFDSLAMSMGVGFLALEAANMMREKAGLSAILARLEAIRGETLVYYVMPTLKYLRFGGRIGAVAAVLGSTLNLKPVVTISSEGRYITAAKVRGFQHAVGRMEELTVKHFSHRPINLAVVYADALDTAKALAGRLQNALMVIQLHLRQISPVLGLHSGPGLVGIAAYPVE